MSCEIREYTRMGLSEGPIMFHVAKYKELNILQVLLIEGGGNVTRRGEKVARRKGMGEKVAMTENN